MPLEGCEITGSSGRPDPHDTACCMHRTLHALAQQCRATVLLEAQYTGTRPPFSPCPLSCACPPLPSPSAPLPPAHYTLPPCPPFLPPLPPLTQLLDYKHNHPQLIENCAGMLIKVFSNVLAHPLEDKYKQVWNVWRRNTNRWTWGGG